MSFHLSFYCPPFKKKYEIGRAESTLLINKESSALKLISSGREMAPGFLLQ